MAKVQESCVSGKKRLWSMSMYEHLDAEVRDGLGIWVQVVKQGSRSSIDRKDHEKC